jgi:hypothetical protein
MLPGLGLTLSSLAWSSPTRLAGISIPSYGRNVPFYVVFTLRCDFQKRNLSVNRGITDVSKGLSAAFIFRVKQSKSWIALPRR